MPAVSPNSVPQAETPKEFVRECSTFFGEVGQLFGVPRSVGQIYGVLYATPVSLSFSDIIDRLDISKGSASQGLQFLRALGAVNVVPPTKEALAGARRVSNRTQLREYYEPELSLRKLVRGVLEGKVAPLAGSSSRQLSRIRELAERSDSAHRLFLLDRANQLIAWRDQLRTLMPLLNALLGAPR